MSIQVSPEIEANSGFVERVRSANRLIEPLLRRHSQTASGYWDYWRDEHGQDLLSLAIFDAWGYASTDFAPRELDRNGELRPRITDLIGEMLNPAREGSRRERIEIRDAFVTEEDLENFRMALGNLSDLQGAGLKLNNRVRFVPNRPDRFLLTDFAVEVNGDRADEVRQVIQRSKSRLREDAPLLTQADIRESVKRLVEKHRKERQAVPRFAICFRIHDREDIHLLEIADDVEEMQDGALEGVGFNANGSIPGAKSLVLYLIHPNDLRLSHERQPDHIFFRDLRSGQCDFIFPDDGGQDFRAALPELLR
jgi:hypothetical protein